MHFEHRSGSTFVGTTPEITWEIHKMTRQEVYLLLLKSVTDVMGGKDVQTIKEGMTQSPRSWGRDFVQSEETLRSKKE